MIINKVNIDKWLFDYFEGNLSTHEKMEIERFIEANPKFEVDLDSWEDSYDMPQEVPVYDVPNSLYKQSFIVTHKYLVTGLLFLMFSLSGVVYYNINSESSKDRLVANFTADANLKDERSDFSENTKRFSSNSKSQNTQIKVEKNSKIIENGLITSVKENVKNSEPGHFSKKLNGEKVEVKEIYTRVQSTVNSTSNNNALGFKTLKKKEKVECKSLKKKRVSSNNSNKNNIIQKNKWSKSTLNVEKHNYLTYRASKREIKMLENEYSERKIVKYYKGFKKENLNEKYKYLDYNRKRQKVYSADKKKGRQYDKLEGESEVQNRKFEYFDNIAMIGVLFDRKGKATNKRKVSFIDKLKRKELALVNTHDPIFITDRINPLVNNIALTGGLEMTRFKLNAIDSWRGTLNNRVGGVFSADTYLQKINAGLGLVVESKNFNEIGVYSTDFGLIYAQRIEVSENKSLSLGAKFNHVSTTFNSEKLEGQDGDYEVELEQNNSFLISNHQQVLSKNSQNNLSFGAWYDGGYFYGGVNVENIKTKKSENNNANQFVEYINPVKFAVQLGTDYRKNAYSTLIISPQLSYSYQRNKSEFWMGSTLKYKSFLTGIGGSTSNSFKINIGAQGDEMRIIYGFNYAKSVIEDKFYGTHNLSFRYILRSKNNCKK